MRNALPTVCVPIRAERRRLDSAIVVVRKSPIGHEIIVSNRVEMPDCSELHTRGKLQFHEKRSFPVSFGLHPFRSAPRHYSIPLLRTSSSASIKAESILLRKHLAPYPECEVKPRRKGCAISHASELRNPCCVRGADRQGPPRNVST